MMKNMYFLGLIIMFSGCLYQRDFYVGNGFYDDHIKVYVSEGNEKRIIFEGIVTTSELNSLAKFIPLKELNHNSYIFIKINGSSQLIIPANTLNKNGNIIDLKLSEDRKSIEYFYLKIKPK